MAGFFGSGVGDYNRELKTQRDNALAELSVGAIGDTFRGFQEMYAPMANQMGQAAAVGANMDTQSMQANLARQGLGGTGLGTALGAGLRSGATFQTNQLRARLAADAMGQAVGLQQNRAQTLMQQALGMQPEAGQFQTTVMPLAQIAGSAFTTASLFGGGGGAAPGAGSQIERDMLGPY